MLDRIGLYQKIPFGTTFDTDPFSNTSMTLLSRFIDISAFDNNKYIKSCLTTVCDKYWHYGYKHKNI